MLNLTIIYCTGLDKNLRAERSQGLNSICAKSHRWLFSQPQRIEKCKGYHQHPWDCRAHICSIPAPHIRHLQPHPDGQMGWGTEMVGESRSGHAQSTASGSVWKPLERPRRRMWAVNHGVGERTTVKHICISTLIMQTPLNAFSSMDRITKSWRQRKNSDNSKIAVEAVVLRGGVWSHYWIWINLICTYFFIEEISLWSFWKETFEFSVVNNAFL